MFDAVTDDADVFKKLHSIFAQITIYGYKSEFLESPESQMEILPKS